jgi:acyl-CoA synthetase (AMP-forming)/AMP-acid ligase II
MELRSVLRRSATFYADRIAAVAGDRRVTFREAWDRGLRLANALGKLGVRPGDCVATLEDNTLGALDSLLGCAAAGVVRAPLYMRNARESHVAMLATSRARVLIVEEQASKTLADVQDLLPTLEHVIVRDASYEQWLASHEPIDPDPVIRDDDPHLLRHTGGTTGKPKALVITNRMWMSTSRDWFYNFPPPGPGDAQLHIGPLSHASGAQLLPVWAAGGSQVLLNRFDPADTLRIMEEERIAYAFVPPTAMAMLVRVPGAASRDWSALKALLSGSAPISSDTAFRARAIFGDVLYQLYGESEASPLVGMGPKEWFAEVEGSDPLRAIGKPLPWAEVEIWDEAGGRLPFGAEGEITVKCDGAINGFLNAPEETARRFSDGWLRTGDIGRMDSNGYVYLLDRKDDLIISGGFNVYPAELEDVISDHPAVIEVVVFGVPHEKWGESPMAVCYVDKELEVTEEEIIALVSTRLGSYKKPARVELRHDPLPKTAVGKLMRRALREEHWAGRSSSISGV